MIRRKAGELIPWLARVSRPKATDGPVSGHQGRASNLYVIRLDDAVLQKRKFRERNPHYRLRAIRLFRKPCVYVGQTWHDPEVRFQQHKDGDNASPIVRKYGMCLLRKKYEHLNPVPASEALEREEELAIDLQEKGYAVWWN